MAKTNLKTIEDIENMQGEFLKSEDVMSVMEIGKRTFYSNLNSDAFPFPILRIGKKVIRIPKRPFIEYLKNGYCRR